jgi:hypothetical protein
MNEERVIEFKLKVKDGKGKKYEIEKQEIIITLYPSKGLFGDKIFIGSLSQGEFMPEQEPVDLISYSAKFKKNP